jgi:hypothetical protein
LVDRLENGHFDILHKELRGNQRNIALLKDEITARLDGVEHTTGDLKTVATDTSLDKKFASF